MSVEMVEIDGSQGEGGGQMLRTALALSMHTRRPFRMANVRAKREKRGLLRQHLTSVLAAAKLTNAEVSGAELGSVELEFRPGALVSGDFEFAIGTAGSTSLVLQAVLPPLLVGTGRTRLKLSGGTHNSSAPPFEFFERTLAPLLRTMGAQLELELIRPGFYPAGGGEIVVTVEPVARLAPIELLERGAIRSHHAFVRLSNLQRYIGQIELTSIEQVLGWPVDEGRIDFTRNALGPGNAVLIAIECDHVTEVFSSFGERGLPAARVGMAVAHEAKAWLDSGAPVGMHLADQLIVPMVMAGRGAFRASELTEHARTVIEIVQRFVEVAIAVEERAKGDVQFVVAPRRRDSESKP